ncbi:hypothetical protein FRX31_029420, partial [Thalictrum thalictroides]
MSTVVDVLEKEILVNTPPDPFQFSMPRLNFSMLPSQEVILDIHSEASTVVHESLAISNPTLVAASNVYVNAFKGEEKKDKAEKDSDDEHAISNFSEQLRHEESKTSSEIEKLLSEMGTTRPQPFSLSDLE